MSERAGRPFLILTVAFFTLLLGSNLPTPLYAVYRERFGFSSAVLTLVFATYMVVLVPTLLLCGQLSDRVGRKRVIAAGLVTAAAAWASSLRPPPRRGCSRRAPCRGCRSGWSPARPRPGSSSSSPTAIASAQRSTR
ncbi:MAG: MFS transporter [Solirubrobacteraceae bacterium]